MSPAIVLRREQTSDHAAVAAVHREAFASPDLDHGEPPPEVELVAALRRDAAFVPALSVVAVSGERIVGHGIGTQAHVGPRPAIGLGPIGVHPELQRRGIGSALMRHLLGAVDALGFPVVALVGSTEYYARFGFRPAVELGVESPVSAWGDHFQALRCAAWTPNAVGPFRYARPFEPMLG